jgi:hypothetical protein
VEGEIGRDDIIDFLSIELDGEDGGVSVLGEVLVDLLAGCAGLDVESVVDWVDLLFVEGGQVEEEAFGVELFGDLYFLFFGGGIHADYDFVVVAMCQ